MMAISGNPVRLTTLIALAVVAGAAGARAAGPRAVDLTAQRNKMIDECVVAAGVKNERVIQAMRDTKRHEFIRDREQRKLAYFDMALPIGEGATISPPYVVASMTEHLDPQASDVVLEIGTGSGYQAAVLSPLVKQVYSIEIKPVLGSRAKAVLAKLGYKNVFTTVGDGYKGWPEHAPFDKIIVTCSPEKIPRPLIDQLKEGGRMIIPEGERFRQVLYLYRKVAGKMEREAVEATMFVPMTGKAEELRELAYDSTRPALVNGGFEESTVIEGLPDGWYYVRQATLDTDHQAPEGKQCLTFRNQTPGRFAQVLQSFGVDGKKIRALEISLWVRRLDVRPGRTERELPAAWVYFFDASRAQIGTEELGPWTGTVDWTEKRMTIAVPKNAKLVNLCLGMSGATGEVSYDDVRIRAVGTK
ncbi:MAG TPA: protein-L-isoaspartate(D-aspartate) O-methyltransferase [Pirellulales bacterium]|nr:protein-L-isoaspartate(D-aspartate) O-methyltransferase [Pirellulales bacterium]